MSGPDIQRVGEPVLIRGPLPGSVKLQNKYEIRTTPLPGGAHGLDWCGCFNSQFTGPRPIPGFHDGNKITVECWPDDEPKLVETVDAAIDYANEQIQRYS